MRSVMMNFVSGCILGAGIMITPSAQAASFNIAIAGETGLFDAPAAGGLLSSFSITLNGVTYDSLSAGPGAAVYQAVDNDIRGNPGTEAFILNSTAGTGCLALECVLSLESSVDPGVIPPLYALFPLDMGIPGTVTQSGEYMISAVPSVDPVPLPASVLLLGGALGLIAGLRRLPRKRARGMNKLRHSL